MVAPTLEHPLPTHGSPPRNLRICSLLPSATETVGRLGLADHLVCVTHCCDVAPDAATLDKLLASGAAVRATSSWVKPDTLSQRDIDDMVKACRVLLLGRSRVVALSPHAVLVPARE